MHTCIADRPGLLEELRADEILNFPKTKLIVDEALREESYDTSDHLHNVSPLLFHQYCMYHH